ncbi:MAG: excinuclease ABC subunit UvrC [Christensenellales bacterium]
MDLQPILDNLPDKPGVYIMKNGQGEVIYVGKAISLKNRVRQYFQQSRSHALKEQVMAQKVSHIDYIVVGNEVEALLLECNLIKRHRPHYNILLKDDKSFPYVRIDFGEDFPRVEVVHRQKRDHARYFGPYIAAHSLREALETVNKGFPLRKCKKDIPVAIRRRERPCLNYQIGRCMGPCTGEVTKEEYGKAVDQVIAFLSGKYGDLTKRLKEEMQQAAKELNFEQAASLRDTLVSVEQIQERQRTALADEAERDAFAVLLKDAETIVQAIFMRSGCVVGSEYYSLEGEGSEEEILLAFLMQYYTEGYVPREVLVDMELPDKEAIEAFLCEKRGRKAELIVPKRGEKKALLELAKSNAVQSLEKLKQKKRYDWERHEGALLQLADELGLKRPPQRIEAYDISNFQGVDSVASMVVFEGGRAAKKEFRRFKIKTVEGPNDFASMAEVITRRFARAQADDEKFSSLPDLILIDGGKGQLSSALEAMERLGMQIPMIGLAKRNEEIFLPAMQEPVVLKRGSNALHLIQRVRDEAHDFALGYHRKLSSKHTTYSQLNDVEGIGEKRKRALLRHFGSVQKIKQASAEELCAVQGMTKNAAEAVYNRFHGITG